MATSQEQPIYSDNHRGSFNLTLIFALVVAFIGVFGNFPLLIIGLAVAAYSWFTSPKQYLIYRDALVFVYGRPRVKAIPFSEISQLETIALPTGERLRVLMVNGRRMMAQPRDPDTFKARLDEALSNYHGEDWGGEYVEGTVARENQLEDVSSSPEPLGSMSDEPPPFDTSSDSPAPFDSESGEDPRGPTTPY